MIQDSLDCVTFDNYLFDIVKLSDDLSAKALAKLETFLSVDCKLCRRLVSLLPVMFVDNLRVFSVAFFVVDFNLLSCGFNNFMFAPILSHLISNTK